MLIVTVVASLFVLVATLLPLSKHPHWVVRMMDFPRLQIAILAALVLVIDYCFLDIQGIGRWLLIVAIGACFVWQLSWVLPYTRIWPCEVKAAKADNPDKQLSIITSNVLQTNKNSSALIALVNSYQPDILVTLETDSWWEDQLKVLEKRMPYSIKCPLDNLYGMHVYSTLPFTEEEIAYLVEDHIPSMHFCLTLRSGDKVNMHFVHPAPPSPTENDESTERDAELVIIAKSVADTEQPVIVTGDLNDVAWSDTTRLFRKVSGLLDPRIGRGMFNTFHAQLPFLRWPLDHLFHSSHFRVKDIQRLPSIGSDHFPLFTVLVYDPASGAEQEGLSAQGDDYAQAEEIADKKQVSKRDVPTLNK